MFATSWLIKKNQRIWIFGAWHGKTFTGNPKYFYLYVLEKHKEINPIWISESDAAVKQVKIAGGKAFRYCSFKALYYSLIGGVYIYNISLQDIKVFFLKKAITVNLWHGMPVKNIHRDHDKEKAINPVKIIHDYLLGINPDYNADLMIASSEISEAQLKEVFTNSEIAITGQPREDMFFSEISKLELLNKLRIPEDKMIITYLPTYRNKGGRFQSLISLASVRNYLEKNQDIILLEKAHKNESRDYTVILYPDNYINFKTDGADTQELLQITDILVSDYSSVIFDFLLLSRPILLYTYDLEEYQAKRGLLFDFQNVDFGKIVSNEKELLAGIDYCIKNYNREIEKFKQCRDVYHKHYDGKNSERVFNRITRLINETYKFEKKNTKL